MYLRDQYQRCKYIIWDLKYDFNLKFGSVFIGKVYKMRERALRAHAFFVFCFDLNLFGVDCIDNHLKLLKSYRAA